jgi:predicted SAM-dependent methyltransferase
VCSSDLEKKFDLKHIELPDCDQESKMLNLGCGFDIVKGAVNVDNSDICKPDIKVDLNQFPWPFKDDEFSHVIAKDVLEHLGETSEDFIKVLKELYRVSNHGAIWEVQVPHWRCDNALNDPTHRRLITLGMFEIFDQSKVHNRLLVGEGISQLAFDHKIDIEVCETEFDYTGPWKEKIKQGLSNEELVFALNTFNNVAESMRLLIQVHKPGRVSQKEIDKLTERVYQS